MSPFSPPPFFSPYAPVPALISRVLFAQQREFFLGKCVLLCWCRFLLRKCKLLPPPWKPKRVSSSSPPSLFRKYTKTEQTSVANLTFFIPFLNKWHFFNHGAFLFVKKCKKNLKNASFLVLGHFFRCPFVVKSPFMAFFHQRCGTFSFRGVGKTGREAFWPHTPAFFSSPGLKVNI